MIFRKLFLIKTISNLPKWDKQLKSKVQDFKVRLDLVIRLHLWWTTAANMQLSCLHQDQAKTTITSRWTDCSMFNMSASKQSSKKNMNKGWTSSIRESRRDNLNRDHIKMRTWYSCKTTSKTSTTSTKNEPILKEASLDNRRAKVEVHQADRDLIYPLSKQKIMKGLWTLRVSKEELMQLIIRKTVEYNQIAVRTRIENSITNFILIQLKEQLKWWENNINQPL